MLLIANAVHTHLNAHTAGIKVASMLYMQVAYECKWMTMMIIYLR